jgi:hypothetical protein
MYVLFWLNQVGVPTFVAAGRGLLGSHGLLDHILGTLGFLAAGAIWGGLYGLLVSRPSVLNGVAFGLLPTLFHWLVVAPIAGDGLFNNLRPWGIALPLLFYALIWGGLVGQLCHHWLAPPYAADTPPTSEA